MKLLNDIQLTNSQSNVLDATLPLRKLALLTLTSDTTLIVGTVI